MSARPVRQTIPALIYLLPVLANTLVAQCLFINAVRLAHAGVGSPVVANTVTVWSGAYLLACPVIGRFATAANAVRMMLGSMVGMALIAALFTVVDAVAGIYSLMALAGVAAALFFPPFQVFMKAVDRMDHKPLAYSTGLYTFAWSLGFASGPFVSGFLMDLGPAGWKYACWLAVVVAITTGVGVLFLRPQGRGQDVIQGCSLPRATPEDYSRQMDLAWVGWVSGGVGVILITFIRAVFPVRAAAVLHLSQSMQGLLFFLLSCFEALTCLALCRGRYWMYRPTAIATFGVLGVAGLLAFGFGQSLLVLMVGAALFGVYAGSFFFYQVFHALVHPRRSSQYVSINESVTGICGMAGAVIGGWLADRFGFGTLYATGAGLLFLTLGFQWVIHRRGPAR
jgi:predicted MFS family arabinose efflux permease